MEHATVIDVIDDLNDDNFALVCSPEQMFEVANVENPIEQFEALEFPSELQFQLDTAEEYISEQGLIPEAKEKSNLKCEEGQDEKPRESPIIAIMIDNGDDKNDDNFKIICYDEELFKMNVPNVHNPLEQISALRFLSQLQIKFDKAEQNVCEENIDLYKDLILPCENLATEESNSNANDAIDSTIDEIIGNPNTDNSMEIGIQEQIESQSTNFFSFDDEVSLPEEINSIIDYDADMKLYDYDVENNFDTDEYVDPFDETMAIPINDVNFGISESFSFFTDSEDKATTKNVVNFGKLESFAFSTDSQDMTTSFDDVNLDTLECFASSTDSQDMAIPLNDLNFGIPDSFSFFTNGQDLATPITDGNFDIPESFALPTDSRDMASPENDINFDTSESLAFPMDSQFMTTPLNYVNFDTPESLAVSTDSEEMVTSVIDVNFDSPGCLAIPTVSQDTATSVNDVNFDTSKSSVFSADSEEMATPVHDVNNETPVSFSVSAHSEEIATSVTDVNLDFPDCFAIPTGNQDTATHVNDVNFDTPENFALPTSSQDMATSVNDVNFDTRETFASPTSTEDLATSVNYINFDSPDCFIFPTNNQDMATSVNDVNLDAPENSAFPTNSQDISHKMQPDNKFVASTDESDLRRIKFPSSSDELKATNVVDVNNGEPLLVHGIFYLTSNDGDYFMFYKPNKNNPSVLQLRFVPQAEEPQQHEKKPPDPMTGENNGAAVDPNRATVTYPEPIISQTNLKNSEGFDPIVDRSSHSVTTEPDLANILKDSIAEGITMDQSVEDTVEIKAEPGPADNAEDKTTNRKRYRRMYICKLCGYKSKRRCSLETHVRTCKRKGKRVNECEMCSTTEKRWGHMMKLARYKEAVYCCLECDHVTTVYGDLKSHMREEH